MPSADSAERIRQAQAAASGVLGGQSGMVFMGSTTDRGPALHERQPALVPLTEAIAQFYDWTTYRREDFTERLFNLGLISTPSTEQAFGVWRNAVAQAADLYQTGRKITPLGVIDTLGGLSDGTGTGIGVGGRESLARTVKSVDRRVALPSRTDMKAAVTAIFQEALGRDPTGNEVKRYSNLIRTTAQKNPIVQRTRTRYDDRGSPVDTDITESGGFDLGSVLRDRAHADPEYASHQAGVTIYNWLQDALRAPVG